MACTVLLSALVSDFSELYAGEVTGRSSPTTTALTGHSAPRVPLTWVSVWF